mmetsp:Transcript_2689/g.5488  ORF Transcript_2689/g.5488 Transcript_2689/m.5488 type:complete len:194 (-) Transcript_2689:1192-1773(-)
MNQRPPSPVSSRERALVRMFETVTASHYTNGNDDDDDDAEVDDLRPLLLMMDIGSCASAEKHTGVNCVTASMGDVVIEHYPRIGELLELRASPVSVGRTSLDIAVVVVAHGRCNASNNNGDDDDDDDDSKSFPDSFGSDRCGFPSRNGRLNFVQREIKYVSSGACDISKSPKYSFSANQAPAFSERIAHISAT